MDEPDQRDFAHWHRLASENLLATTTAAFTDHAMAVMLAGCAAVYGRRAQAEASNEFEKLLASDVTRSAGRMADLLEDHDG